MKDSDPCKPRWTPNQWVHCLGRKSLENTILTDTSVDCWGGALRGDK
jgi:hypothetical protein